MIIRRIRSCVGYDAPVVRLHQSTPMYVVSRIARHAHARAMVDLGVANGTQRPVHNARCRCVRFFLRFVRHGCRFVGPFPGLGGCRRFRDVMKTHTFQYNTYGS